MWLVSIQRSIGKAFAGIKKLTAQHKMHLYCIETSRVVTVGSHLVATWAREQHVTQSACLRNWDLLVCLEEGQGKGEQSGFLALSSRCGQEETTGGAWAELVLRCTGPRAVATVWTPPYLPPTHTWMTSLAAWPGPGSSSSSSLSLPVALGLRQLL